MMTPTRLLLALALLSACPPSPDDITITIDRTPPEVSFSSPPSSSSVHGSFDVTVAATDNVAVAAVELWVGGDSAGSLGAAPYTWSIDSTQLASGPLTLEATATDGVGLEATASRSLDVGQLPEINLTAPGSSVSAATVTISASASDDLGIDHVEFRVDGVLIDTDWSAPWRASWSPCEWGDGARTVEVTGEDFGGQTATDSATVTVALLDSDGDGATVCEDCDDGNAAVYVGASEVCDGLDNDCVGRPPDIEGSECTTCPSRPDLSRQKLMAPVQPHGRLLDALFWSLVYFPPSLSS